MKAAISPSVIPGLHIIVSTGKDGERRVDGGLDARHLARRFSPAQCADHLARPK